ncbi:hypothetical protein ACFYQA_27550 [Streptomyces sp. NPDC005774]|uniref:hypothetical protein n=1 Tax=Streptomyces sp. NPDC005774 TaxID=3364728 RepID=UPI0036A371E6
MSTTGSKRPARVSAARRRTAIDVRPYRSCRADRDAELGERLAVDQGAPLQEAGGRRRVDAGEGVAGRAARMGGGGAGGGLVPAVRAISQKDRQPGV